MTVLDNITNDGGNFDCQTEKNLTQHYKVRSLEVLKERIGGESVLFLELGWVLLCESSLGHASGEQETKTVVTVQSRVRAGKAPK